MLYCLGNNNKKRVCYMFNRCRHHRLNYIVHISNNITLFLNIVDLVLVEAKDAEPANTGGLLYFCGKTRIKTSNALSRNSCGYPKSTLGIWEAIIFLVSDMGYEYVL